MAKIVGGRSGKFIVLLFGIMALVFLPGAVGATLVTVDFEFEDWITTLSIDVTGDKYTYSFSDVEENGWEIIYMSIGYGWDGPADDPTKAYVRPGSYGIDGGVEIINPPGNQEEEGTGAIVTTSTITIEDDETNNATHVLVHLGSLTSMDSFFITNPQPLVYQSIWVEAQGPEEEVLIELFPGFFVPGTITPSIIDPGTAYFPSNVPVPEPGTLLLVAVGIGAYGVLYRKKIKGV